MIVAALLALAVVFYRIALGFADLQGAEWLHNFSPLCAVALCGAIYFPRRAALWAAPLALLLSDLVLNARNHFPLLSWEMLARYGAVALVVLMGWQLRGRTSLTRTLLASAAGALVFYVLTNSVSWLGEPGYAKTAAGWLQALTTGLPDQHPATIVFFRNSLLSDLSFTALFLICLGRQGRQAAPAPLKQAEMAC